MRSEQPTPPTPAGAGTETPLDFPDSGMMEDVSDIIGRNGWNGLAATVRSANEALTVLRRQAEADRAAIAELEKQLEDTSNVVGATRQMSIDAMNKVRAEMGISPENPEPAYLHVRRVVAQLASADKDRERMDWADKNMPYILQSIDRDGRPYYSIMNPFNDGWRTLRAAIDSALQPSASIDHGAREKFVDQGEPGPGVP